MSLFKNHTALLKKASRSFYLSLRILPKGTRDITGLAYLLCRIADSITDTNVVPHEQKEKLLELFERSFSTFPFFNEHFAPVLKEVENQLIPSDSTEHQLLKNLHDIITLFLAVSKSDQIIISKVVCGVIRGMKMDLHLFGATPESPRFLETDQELEDYLSWIGGEPGRFWSDVLLAHTTIKPFAPVSWRDNGIEFGRGLQMVNILRDIGEDFKRGRSYVPLSRLKEKAIDMNIIGNEEKVDFFIPLYQEYILNSANRLSHGLTYLEEVPTKQLRARLSVWWPLIIGMETLKQLRNNKSPYGSVKVKVSRGKVYYYLLESIFIIWSNKLLKKRFDSIKEYL